MNLSALVQAVAVNAGVKEHEAGQVVSAMLQALTMRLKSGHSVKLAGFGSFNVRERAQRPGRNPKTGEPIVITKRKKVVFTPGGQITKGLK